MKLLRVTLVCSLLLLAASPSFAIACKSCTAPGPNFCEATPGSNTKCQWREEVCQTVEAIGCNPFTDESVVLSEWTVTSIEISCPAEGTKVVTSPAAIADTGLSETIAQK